MRPNTPHFVLTAESAICHGGHFYAMSSIRDSIFGIYHMFCCNAVITNTEHTKDSHLLILRIVTYLHHMLVRDEFGVYSSDSYSPHVPDVTSVDGTLDLFYVCIVAELGELLNPKAYQKLRRNDKELEEERLAVVYVRGLSREIQDWWCSTFTFFDPTSRMIIKGELVYEDLLSHQIKTLVNYKRVAQEKKLAAKKDPCTPAAFEAMAEKYFPGYKLRSLPRGAIVEDFQWNGGGYTLRRFENEGDMIHYCSCELASESMFAS